MQNKNQTRFLSTIAAALVTIAAVFAFGKTALAIDAPFVQTPKNRYVVPPDTELKVTGLVPKSANVYIFVDGKLIGGTRAKKTAKATTSFSYTIKNENALAIGRHTIQTQAYVGSEKSSYTERITYDIPRYWPRRIDGVNVSASKANIIPTAVMIENLSIVRPQSGLGSASIVYETLAEGGIPRFLAIFAKDTMKKVGPVRSARPYYVDWAKEYQGPVFHAGGSRDALNEFGRRTVRSVDALVNRTAKYFYRAGRVETTHNLFTDAKQIKRYRSDARISAKKANFRAWKFKDDPKLSKRPNETKTLTVDFKSGLAYIVRYRYDRRSNSWLRWNGTQPHRDADLKNAQIKAKNVIVQLVKKERVLDAKKRISLEITGRGKGWLLQDGTLRQITWKKTGLDGRTVYFEKNGKEVTLTRGSTWIEVVPENRTVGWK